MSIKQILQEAPIIPIITVHNLDHIIPLAKAIIAGGINTLEVTLRTPVALDAVAQLELECPQAVIGVGTVTHIEHIEDIQSLGISFAVSPGVNSSLINAAKKAELPYLPAVATPSDILIAREHYLTELKFYPAEHMGGIKMLKQYAQVFPDIKFCATGGINNKNLTDYLALPNVISVGGSWLAPQSLIAAGKWGEITRLVKATVGGLGISKTSNRKH